MKILSAFLIGLVVLLGPVERAHASGCDARARAEANRVPGGTVIAAQAITNAQGKTVCRIAIKLPPRKGKPGRVITKTVRP